MLLEKQQEVIQWAMQNNVVIDPDIIKLWDQAMSLGEEKGKKAYQEFLDKYKEFQQNPPKRSVSQELTNWQKELLLKQQEVVDIAKRYEIWSNSRHNITLPKDLVNLWEQAISVVEEKGKKIYEEFLQKWEQLKDNTVAPKDEPLAGQYVNHTYKWPTSNNNDNTQNHQQPNNQGTTDNKESHYSHNRGYSQPNDPYSQRHIDSNWRPNSYGQQYPYQFPYQSPYQDQYPYQDYSPYQSQYPYQYSSPYQDYSPYQNSYQYPYQSPYQSPYQDQGSYQGGYPYQGQSQGGYRQGYNREPLAGQQLNEWQNKLQDAGKEVGHWAELNQVLVPPTLVEKWNDAMQNGTEEAYDEFMQLWKEIREDPSQAETPSQTQNTTYGMTDRAGKEGVWQVALINQIEGQNIISLMLGLNMVNELTELRDQAANANKDSLGSIADLVDDIWKKINEEIKKGSRRR
eukprot:TRINITY_DN3640_c0_g1_i1.p1 TRINITY_DN3640_c0_g1~~TRINITY_DN3640_c0_g1_i1.p1  ORF type:complete len:456 (-),score=90.10 TRINITY_DN3640_c0_g1_i1:206-1573(-)